MANTTEFDAESPEHRKALFKEILGIYPELNEGILEAAWKVIREGARSGGRVQWALWIVKVATETEKGAVHIGGHL